MLRRWERASREQTVMCNQAAGLSRCLTKVQDAMSSQLKTLHSDKSKGKSSERMQQSVDELEYLVTFNQSISQAMARTMQDFSEGVFISMANFTATSHQTCLQHTQTLVALYRELGWLINKEKSELDPKQVFNFVGYQFDLREGKVRPTPESGQTLTDKILSILSGPVCPFRQFMSLIGLLTATEKQVHLGRLHMRPIQWHLNNWRVPESLEKVIPVPRLLQPHLRWWLEESNVLPGQLLHPLKHALQIFTDASKEGWGAHLNERIARGTWSLPESKLHINHLELKAVFLALQEFQDLCSNNILLVATDNTTVVAYINKEGGMKSGGPVCPTVENPVLVHQETGNSQGMSHPRPAERDNRQAIQTWPDHSNRVVPSPRSVSSYMFPVAPAPSGLVCHQIQQQTPTVCVTGSRPPSFGSGCTQPVLGKPGPYAFPPAAILGKVVEKLHDYPCNRIHLIAPGWPNMPWFWDLVAMSSQIPLCLPNLPNLVSQPFNQTLHRNLSNLKLHAWLLEPQQSRSRDSLRQW